MTKDQEMKLDHIIKSVMYALSQIDSKLLILRKQNAEILEGITTTNNNTSNNNG